MVDSSMSRLQWSLHKSTCVVKLHRMTHTCTHKQEFVKLVDSGCVLRLPQCEPPDCATDLLLSYLSLPSQEAKKRTMPHLGTQQKRSGSVPGQGCDYHVTACVLIPSFLSRVAVL